MNKRFKSVVFKRRSSCIVEDLVSALHEHIAYSFAGNCISADDLRQSLPGSDRFAHMSPQKCDACQRVFFGREDYVARTKPSPGVVETNDGVLEYRTCECSAPIILMTNCSRDTGVFGMECRAYFDLCVEKLVGDFQFSRSDAQQLTRVIFQQVFETALQSA